MWGAVLLCSKQVVWGEARRDLLRCKFEILINSIIVSKRSSTPFQLFSEFLVFLFSHRTLSWGLNSDLPLDETAPSKVNFKRLIFCSY